MNDDGDSAMNPYESPEAHDFPSVRLQKEADSRGIVRQDVFVRRSAFASSLTALVTGIFVMCSPCILFVGVPWIVWAISAPAVLTLGGIFAVTCGVSSFVCSKGQGNLEPTVLAALGILLGLGECASSVLFWGITADWR